MNNTAILFIHGILGTPNHFNGLMDLVPAEWTIYNMLLDGHGGTVDDFAASGMAKWKAQVHKQVQQLENEFEHVFIVAHSMGTLFALEESLSCVKVEGLFLLNVPLAVYLHPKIIFEKVKPGDTTAAAMQKAYSITPDKRLWKYLKWIPNYVALFREIGRVRRRIDKIQVSCCVYQSKNDELVRKSAVRYLEDNSNINIHVLPLSGHFYYEESDMEEIRRGFQKFADRRLCT